MQVMPLSGLEECGSILGLTLSNPVARGKRRGLCTEHNESDDSAKAVAYYWDKIPVNASLILWRPPNHPGQDAQSKHNAPSLEGHKPRRRNLRIEGEEEGLEI